MEHQANATPHSGEDTLRTRYSLAGRGMRQGRVLPGHGYGHRPFLARTPASSTMAATAESGTQGLSQDDAQEHRTLTGSIVTGIYDASSTDDQDVSNTAKMSSDQPPENQQEEQKPSVVGEDDELDEEDRDEADPARADHLDELA